MANTKRAAGRPRTHVPPLLVHQLRSEGLSFRQIARKTGFGYGSVRRAYQVYLKDMAEPKDMSEPR